MTDVKIPPSLKWLITKRARLLGDLHKFDALLPKQIQALEERVHKTSLELDRLEKELAGKRLLLKHGRSAINADLQTIEAALRMHEIQLEFDRLPVIKGQEAGRWFQYGEMTRLIFECLGNAKGHPLSTIEVALHIAEKGNLILGDTEFNEFRLGIRHRLKSLCREGRIARGHQAKTKLDGRWMLKPEDISA